MDLTNPETIRRIMQAGGLKFNKNLGQNFLIDHSVLEQTIEASGIDQGFGVLEIGPGIGTLTAALAETAGKVVAVELDRGIAAYLTKTFAPYRNVEIIQKDILKTDLRALLDQQFQGLRMAVVANLPYYITTPIIMNLLEQELPFESITVMVQKEVAQRMAATCNTKAYGALSVAVQFYADVQIICQVPPSSFMPPPKVTSAVVRLDLKNHTCPNVKDRKEFFKVVKSAFGQRRKTLVNALASVYDLPKEQLKNLVEHVCGNQNIRGEALNIGQFIQIYENLQ